MDKDEVAARRWFRQRLAEISEQYPELLAPEAQQRLDKHLMDEKHVCPESRQDVRLADPREANATSNRVTMTLAPGQLEALEQLAEAKGVKMNVILREAIAQYLKNEEPKGG